MKISISSILTSEFSNKEFDSLSLREESLASGLKVRKDEADLSDDEKNRYISAVQALIANNKFNEIVNIHADGSTDMHGRNMVTGAPSPSGLQRFLSWHRAYLMEFEKLLQEIDPNITIPYWNWTKNQRFPDWLAEFLPAGLVNRNGQIYDVERYVGRDTTLPDANATLLGMAPVTHQNYTSFTTFLEGWRPYGAHNQVHVFVGGGAPGLPVGEMSTMYSPSDPVFWLHHAECDRLWHIWQLAHKDEHPSLIGRSAIMNPWTYRFKDLVDIQQLGYEYQSLEILPST